MMTTDQHNLPVTGASAEDCAAYDRYVQSFLAYGADIRDLFAAAEAAPGCALMNAHAAGLHFAYEGAEAWTKAQPFLARMRAARPGAGPREQLYCDAIEAWALRDYHRALTILDELTVRWPADICAIKWGQYHAFNLGDHAALLRFGDRATIAHAGRPYTHGLRAFALEQNHRIEEAEDEGIHASEIALDDAWAHHAVAHVYETQHRWIDGRRWLDRCAHTWQRKGVFIREHNWWHAALFRLHAGDDAAALSVFDTRLWGELPDFPQEQIGAISILWRLDIKGVECGERWAPVVAQARQRAGEHILPFHDLHYVYALARAGDAAEADAQLASMERHAETLEGDAALTWRRATVPAARGAVAFARGEWTDAAEHFAAALPNLQSVGGSHAQRHLFVEAFEAAQQRAAGDVARAL